DGRIFANTRFAVIGKASGQRLLEFGIKADLCSAIESSKGLLEAFSKIDTPIILPLHPRTRKTLGMGLEAIGGSVRVIDPIPYLDMLMLEKHCRMILTDSGGVQKEAYWFDRPCITLRDETEWVELVDAGCNRIVGANPQAIGEAVKHFEATGLPDNRPSDLYGNGEAARKIVEIISSAR
ncbi:MAG TPA: hypothetical protein ENL03_04860, partial [Phycisphaerae bacterium]|nr:hypothetical protein [Phycisphaerae bacterium]